MGGAFPAFGVVLSLSFCLFVFFCFGEGSEGTIEVPRLDGRIPHFGARKRSLGTGWEKSLKAEKPTSCHSPFELDAAG